MFLLGKCGKSSTLQKRSINTRRSLTMDRVVKMKFKKQVIGILLMMLTVAITRAYAQTNEIENLYAILK